MFQAAALPNSGVGGGGGGVPAGDPVGEPGVGVAVGTGVVVGGQKKHEKMTDESVIEELTKTYWEEMAIIFQDASLFCVPAEAFGEWTGSTSAMYEVGSDMERGVMNTEALAGGLDTTLMPTFPTVTNQDGKLATMRTRFVDKAIILHGARHVDKLHGSAMVERFGGSDHALPEKIIRKMIGDMRQRPVHSDLNILVPGLSVMDTSSEEALRKSSVEELFRTCFPKANMKESVLVMVYTLQTACVFGIHSLYRDNAAKEDKKKGEGEEDEDEDGDDEDYGDRHHMSEAEMHKEDLYLGDKTLVTDVREGVLAACQVEYRHLYLSNNKAIMCEMQTKTKKKKQGVNLGVSVFTNALVKRIKEENLHKKIGELTKIPEDRYIYSTMVESVLRQIFPGFPYGEMQVEGERMRYGSVTNPSANAAIEVLNAVLQNMYTNKTDTPEAMLNFFKMKGVNINNLRAKKNGDAIASVTRSTPTVNNLPAPARTWFSENEARKRRDKRTDDADPYAAIAGVFTTAFSELLTLMDCTNIVHMNKLITLPLKTFGGGKGSKQHPRVKPVCSLLVMNKVFSPVENAIFTLGMDVGLVKRHMFYNAMYLLGVSRSKLPAHGPLDLKSCVKTVCDGNEAPCLCAVVVQVIANGVVQRMTMSEIAAQESGRKLAGVKSQRNASLQMTYNACGAFDRDVEPGEEREPHIVDMDNYHPPRLYKASSKHYTTNKFTFSVNYDNFFLNPVNYFGEGALYCSAARDVFRVAAKKGETTTTAAGASDANPPGDDLPKEERKSAAAVLGVQTTTAGDCDKAKTLDEKEKKTEAYPLQKLHMDVYASVGEEGSVHRSGLTMLSAKLRKKAAALMMARIRNHSTLWMCAALEKVDPEDDVAVENLYHLSFPRKDNEYVACVEALQRLKRPIPSWLEGGESVQGGDCDEDDDEEAGAIDFLEESGGENKGTTKLVDDATLSFIYHTAKERAKAQCVKNFAVCTHGTDHDGGEREASLADELMAAYLDEEDQKTRQGEKIIQPMDEPPSPEKIETFLTSSLFREMYVGVYCARLKRTMAKTMEVVNQTLSLKAGDVDRLHKDMGSPCPTKPLVSRKIKAHFDMVGQGTILNRSNTKMTYMVGKNLLTAESRKTYEQILTNFTSKTKTSVLNLREVTVRVPQKPREAGAPPVMVPDTASPPHTTVIDPFSVATPMASACQFNATSRTKDVTGPITGRPGVAGLPSSSSASRPHCSRFPMDRPLADATHPEMLNRLREPTLCFGALGEPSFVSSKTTNKGVDYIMEAHRAKPNGMIAHIAYMTMRNLNILFQLTRCSAASSIVKDVMERRTSAVRKRKAEVLGGEGQGAKKAKTNTGTSRRRLKKKEALTSFLDVIENAEERGMSTTKEDTNSALEATLRGDHVLAGVFYIWSMASPLYSCTRSNPKAAGRDFDTAMVNTNAYLRLHIGHVNTESTPTTWSTVTIAPLYKVLLNNAGGPALTTEVPVRTGQQTIFNLVGDITSYTPTGTHSGSNPVTNLRTGHVPTKFTAPLLHFFVGESVEQDRNAFERSIKTNDWVTGNGPPEKTVVFTQSRCPPQNRESAPPMLDAAAILSETKLLDVVHKFSQQKLDLQQAIVAYYLDAAETMAHEQGADMSPQWLYAAIRRIHDEQDLGDADVARFVIPVINEVLAEEVRARQAACDQEEDMMTDDDDDDVDDGAYQE